MEELAKKIDDLYIASNNVREYSRILGEIAYIKSRLRIEEITRRTGRIDVKSWEEIMVLTPWNYLDAVESCPWIRQLEIRDNAIVAEVGEQVVTIDTTPSPMAYQAVCQMFQEFANDYEFPFLAIGWNQTKMDIARFASTYVKLDVERCKLLADRESAKECHGDADLGYLYARMLDDVFLLSERLLSYHYFGPVGLTSVENWYYILINWETLNPSYCTVVKDLEGLANQAALYTMREAKKDSTNKEKKLAESAVPKVTEWKEKIGPVVSVSAEDKLAKLSHRRLLLESGAIGGIGAFVSYGCASAAPIAEEKEYELASDYRAVSYLAEHKEFGNGAMYLGVSTSDLDRAIQMSSRYHDSLTWSGKNGTKKKIPYTSGLAAYSLEDTLRDYIDSGATCGIIAVKRRVTLDDIELVRSVCALDRITIWKISFGSKALSDITGAYYKAKRRYILLAPVNVFVDYVYVVDDVGVPSGRYGRILDIHSYANLVKRCVDNLRVAIFSGKMLDDRTNYCGQLETEAIILAKATYFGYYERLCDQKQMARDRVYPVPDLGERVWDIRSQCYTGVRPTLIWNTKEFDDGGRDKLERERDKERWTFDAIRRRFFKIMIR
jgi:hypothetical protein